jgi:glycosyltransferase involved in cell wall biosynthesis
VTAPWLSVVVPTYNGAAYLPAALESVAAQADDGVEVVAVDDGSTDATPAILESFAGRLRLTVVRRRVGNWVANTNLGLEHARGEWVCFLHQDDLWRPGRLAAVRRARIAAEMDSGNARESGRLCPELVHARIPRRPRRPLLGVRENGLLDRNSYPARIPALILSAADFITATGRPAGVWRCPLAPGPRGNDPAHVAARLLVQNFVPLPTAVFRRSDALAVGGLDPDLWYTADWDFWLKLAARGPTRYLPQPLAAFRLHPESQTVKRSGGLDGFRRQHDVIWERHWPAWRDRVANPERIEAAARLSVEVNVLLAGLLHRGGVNWRLAAAALQAGPAAWGHFVSASRFFERVIARIRAGLVR